MPRIKKYSITVDLEVEAVDESQAVVIAREKIQLLEASCFDVFESEGFIE